MIDAENLTRLLGHLPPKTFHELVVESFRTPLTALDEKQNKTEQRAAMSEQLLALPIGKRKGMEDEAEKIMLLSDGPGQDVIEGFRELIPGLNNRISFAALKTQHERAYWLYSNNRKLFAEALDARQADIFRQSSTCYSGFTAPAQLNFHFDEVSISKFHSEMAQKLACNANDVAVQVFKRMRPDAEHGEDVDLYQVSIHYNRPPEVVEKVENSALRNQEVIRAVSSYATYEPVNGHLEILSRDNVGREELARLVADVLLESPITGERIPLKSYDYQCLAGDFTFDLSTEPTVASAKIIELGYSNGENRSGVMKIWAKDVDDIHTVAKKLIGPTFTFSSHRLNYARISVRTHKAAGERARNISIVMRDENKCNIKTKRDKDRALCDRLLARWGLVKEIGNEQADDTITD